MRACFLTPESQKSLKRDLADRLPVKSTHLTEALAAGFGYRTNAALLAANVMTPGQYLPFSEMAFIHRLSQLTGEAIEDVEFPALPREDRYVEDVFDEVEVLEFRKEQIRFRLPGIDQTVTIRIEPYGSGWFRFIRSHAIHTPTQMGPYRPSRDFDDDAAYAMNRAIDSLSDYYHEAIEAGHAPSASWLVPG